MTVWRVQLKSDRESGISYRDLLDFCKTEQIIGVGWCAITERSDDYTALRDAIYSIEEYRGGETAALRATNAIRSMRPGDLVWTRLGGDASEYYLCQVGTRLWKDRIVTDRHLRYDIGNFVSARWITIGKEECVPGKVVNSFYSGSSVQRVSQVELISQAIWNLYSGTPEDRYELPPLGKSEFWNMISSEELECLVLLYLQSRGYYIYSSTLKLSTAKFEAVLTASDGTHLAYPQVKRNVPLLAEDYIDALDNSNDRIFLFTTSEEYGSIQHPQIMCITKKELEEFMNRHEALLPRTILSWRSLLHE